jgi:chorismate lyase / 3-hydroxybenzoate synthase
MGGDRSPDHSRQVIPPMPIATAKSRLLRIVFGADKTGGFDAGLPVLAGEAAEDLFGAAQPAGRVGALALFQAEGWLLGAATVPLTPGLEAAAHQLYRSIFEATQGWHLARIWNYVPAINEPGPGGLENYRVFCLGRSLAFEQHYGSEFKARLPSASAVGSKSAALTVVFAACTVPPRHVENPLQVPAYDYPGEYGPRAPSFARATVVPGPERAAVFISGTAAIRGHLAVAPHSTQQQLECTLDNLREISGACGLGPDLDRGGSSTRHFKVYLRRAADQPTVAATLEEKLLKSADRVSYLQADMCRASLLVEIEASLFGVTAIRI